MEFDNQDTEFTGLPSASGPSGFAAIAAPVTVETPVVNEARGTILTLGGGPHGDEGPRYQGPLTDAEFAQQEEIVQSRFAVGLDHNS